MKLSIIITGHKEGLLLHKTLLSVVRSVEFAKIKDYETIINLDNADEITKKVAEKWKNQNNVKIFNVSFGNPADNRNDAVKKSRGEFIAIVDGDDLVSENWFKKALDILRKTKKPTVVRPEIHMQFGYNEYSQTIWRMRDSSDKATDAIQMAYWNLWTNVLVAKREILLETPYRAPVNGFGFEDYLLCSELIAKGIVNKIAPETILFYRRREASVTSDHQKTILDYSPLFDIDYIKSLPLSPEINNTSETFSQKNKRRFKRLYRFTFDTAKKIGPINRMVGPVAKRILYKKNMERVPGWLFEEWKKINSIENQLWPTEGSVATLQYHPLTFNPFENQYGLIFQMLCGQLKSNRLDYLFLAPSMSGRGGTEKLIANYIKALKKIHPDWKIGILSTHPFNDLTIEYFKDLDVSMIDFGKYTISIGNYEKNIIWSRILIQTGVKNLHIVNDEYWYRWIADHKKLMISNNYKVNISLFMREFTHEKGRIQTFSDPHLLEIWPTVNKVFTDNQKVVDQALENNAFDPEKFAVHYQPESSDDKVNPKTIDPNKKIKILWASRISFQKRPDILKAVSKKLDDRFEIDAYGLIEKKQFSEDFFNDSNVQYKGGFNGIKSINTDKYDLYLYTSETDGVPNRCVFLVNKKHYCSLLS